MRPNSDFLRGLFYDGDTPRKLGPGVEFDLLFGYRMRRSSKTQRAIDAGHEDILENEQTLARGAELLRPRFR
jgi:hypothetical protein